MKKGFTLLELIVVIIILGILASVAFSQYTKMVEKGRTAEAKAVLGSIRSAQAAYYQEYQVYAVASDLSVTVPSCDADHYFAYATASGTGTSTATRCSAGGKTPNAPAAGTYSITLTAPGTFGGTAGYF